MLNRPHASSAHDAFLVPIEGAWVCRADRPNELGRVLSQADGGVHVDFGPEAGRALLSPGEWGNGLRPGFVVQDVPLSAVRRSRGLGRVCAVRSLCGRDQVLVQFHGDGASHWLPFEQLRRVMDPQMAFIRAAQHPTEGAERAALAMMSHALRLWNEATGALDRLDIDPLPHQIGLVHRIVSSGSRNWLIADDVGLGKTIEVGLLLAALERRQGFRRILVIAPAGLTRQWQDEMQAKFDRRFMIYGRDFEVGDPQDWPRFERVIASLDVVKPQNRDDEGAEPSTRFGALLAAGHWDAVIFDEAHRLSKTESGETTLRYRLAAALRDRTDAMFLLTGTPHQGDQARFQNLLALARPDLAREIDMLEFQPELVRDIVLRNRKIDAVDAEGKFLFRGVMVRRLEVATDGVAELERGLKAYLARGYRAGEAVGGAQGRAIGFVMTVYRKLASSSVYALAAALKRRRAKLAAAEPAAGPPSGPFDAADDDGDDLLERAGEAEPTKAFFADELAEIDALIAAAVRRLGHDPKLKLLMSSLRELVRQSGKKVLVFTEYRETQTYLSLAMAVGGVRAVLLNGGQTLDEKRAAIERFEADADVLISTEAGGEGLNLHRRCHVMVNYDLPWNPARLTQRIGRLYRYGQKEQVIVLNFHARDTIDNEILSGVLDRLDRVVRGLAPVGSEFDERYHAEVMGEVLDRLDVSALLDEAASGRVERSQDRIDAAISAAREAKRLQDEMLTSASAHDPAAWGELGALTTAHLAGFVTRLCPFLGIEIEPNRADPERFVLRLPPELKGRFAEFGARTVIPATTRRGGGRDEAMLDFASPFLRHLVQAAAAPEFQGFYGSAGDGQPGVAAVAMFLGRLQDEQGRSMGESLHVAVRRDDGEIETGPAVLSRLFSGPQRTVPAPPADLARRKAAIDAMRDRAELALAEHCNRLQHPNDLICLAALDTPG